MRKHLPLDTQIDLTHMHRNVRTKLQILWTTTMLAFNQLNHCQKVSRTNVHGSRQTFIKQLDAAHQIIMQTTTTYVQIPRIQLGALP